MACGSFIPSSCRSCSKYFFGYAGTMKGFNDAGISSLEHFQMCHYKPLSLTPCHQHREVLAAAPSALPITTSAADVVPLPAHPYSSCCFAVKFRIPSVTLMSDLLVSPAFPGHLWCCCTCSWQTGNSPMLLGLLQAFFLFMDLQLIPLCAPLFRYCCATIFIFIFIFLTSGDLSSLPRKWQVSFSSQYPHVGLGWVEAVSRGTREGQGQSAGFCGNLFKADAVPESGSIWIRKTFLFQAPETGSSVVKISTNS